MRQYDGDLRGSARDFQKHAVPLLLNEWNVTNICPCEGEENGLAGHLDHDYGIDYLVITEANKPLGMSSRVFYKPEYAYKVTLRKERVGANNQRKPSEYWKHKRAIETGGIYPKFFCCTCIVKGKLVSCVVVEMEDVIRYIDATNPPLYPNYDRDKKQTQWFWAFDWRDMERRGANVLKFKVPTF